MVTERPPGRRWSRPSRWCNWAGGHRLPWFGSGGLQGKRRLAADLVGAEACHGLERHVAVLELPLVVLLHQDGPDETQDAGLVREDADHPRLRGDRLCAALDLL